MLQFFSPLLLVLVLLAIPGCYHFDGSYRNCDPVPERTLATMPNRLSQTGLYIEASLKQVNPEVRSFRPNFQLWSDGASKRRWISLPANGKIDTSDMDAWNFPVGTKLWKEFSRNGVPIETRLLQKIDPASNGWAAVSYVWLMDGSDAVKTPMGMPDAHGTTHDVPPAAQCAGCHGGRSNWVLGFSAIQLSEAPGEIDLAELVKRGLLSEPVTQPFKLPGDPQTQQVLGYLHANCAHCHNQNRPPQSGKRCFDPRKNFDLSLSTERLASVHTTPFYQTALSELITPGNPHESVLYKRFRRDGRFLSRMPPLGTEEIDVAAQEMLERWIEQLESP